MLKLVEYFQQIHDLLTPGGRFLNHAISRPSGSEPLPQRSFIGRYVFPDGELHEVGRVVSAMQQLGLEVQDVESLREDTPPLSRQPGSLMGPGGAPGR